MPKNILVIDDDEDDLEFFCDAVSKALGHNCIKALGGHNALYVLENLILVPDYIFLDLNMHIMPGSQCLVEIRKIYKHVPIIIFSTSVQKVDELLKLGANDFITKPILLSDYGRVIGNIIDNN